MDHITAASKRKLYSMVQGKKKSEEDTVEVGSMSEFNSMKF